MEPGVYYALALMLSTLALLVSIATAVWTGYFQEQSQRRARTIDFLIAWRANPVFLGWLDARLACFGEGETVPAARFNEFLSSRRSGDLSDDQARERREAARAIRSLLNHYEFIALGITTDAFDKEVMRQSIRAIMCNLVADMHEVVADARADSPRAYANLIPLYSEWKDPDQPAIT